MKRKMNKTGGFRPAREAGPMESRKIREGDPAESGLNPYVLILYMLTLFVPVLVTPFVVDNAFNTPKSLLILLGVSTMAGVYCFSLLRNRAVPASCASTPKILVLVILLNFFSFFYTKNYYYTQVAAVMNISCLLVFYFTSLHMGNRKAFILTAVTVMSGILVSLETWLQFFNIFILFRWAEPGTMMGTIGNSNYLGAYLVFPLFAVLGLFFTVKKRVLRLILAAVFIFIMGAFLFSRARASWMGFFIALPVLLWLVKRVYGFSLRGYLRQNPAKTAVAVLLSITVMIGLWYAAPPRFHKMMKFRNVTDSETLRLRIEKYCGASLWLIKQNPLFGTGLWSYRNLVYEAQAELNRIDNEFFKDYPDPKPRRVHNEFLEIVNDGGLLSAAVLSLFFLIIMRHGWMVINSGKIQTRDRVLTASAFCSLISIMLASIFFFPFRINSTLFMTALVMGMIEGIYVREYGKTKKIEVNLSKSAVPVIFMVFVLLVGIVWYTGIRPFLAEMEHFEYKKAFIQGDYKQAENHLLKALFLDPGNSAYCLYASQLYSSKPPDDKRRPADPAIADLAKANYYVERALVDFNGDITRYAAHFLKGILRYRSGSLLEARSEFQKALYYNSEFSPAAQKLDAVNRVIKDHGQVLVKFK